MQNWYRYIMFYRYPGESFARAFAFNEKRMACNAMDLGAIVIEIIKGNSAGRALCTEVNVYPGCMPIAALRDRIDHSMPGTFHVERWDTWHNDIVELP